MAKGKKNEVVERDAMDVVNDLELDEFVERFWLDGNDWKSWIHPKTSSSYTLTITTASSISKADLEACFKLIEFTSSEDYKKSKDGWKPRSKRSEMKLLDLKYVLIQNAGGIVEGFCSFMPTYEDGFAVVYVYEIHMGLALQGTGLGKLLMGYLEVLAAKLPEVTKVMLTVFVANERAVRFYMKLEYEKDEFSPPPKILRNGTKIEKDYVILSKPIIR